MDNLFAHPLMQGALRPEGLLPPGRTGVAFRGSTMYFRVGAGARTYRAALQVRRRILAKPAAARARSGADAG
eukprot:scaffold1595_cov372-Prasinococcus_capsulatus_cf.AAC.2